MKMYSRAALVVVLVAVACGDKANDDEGGADGSTSSDVEEGSDTGSSTATTMSSATSSATSSTTGVDPSTSDSSGEETTGPPPVGPDPIIPEPDGECPEFVSGDQMIGDLLTTIEAGTPGDTKGPLLFYWHGTGSSPSIELPLLVPSAQHDEIMAAGGLIVAPRSNGQNRGGFTPNGVWYEGEDGEGGDLDWVDHVVACAVTNHNIDPKRIYTAGCSAGGLMSGGLALKRSNYIAAASPNSGGIIVGGVELLQDPERVPSVLTMHGGPGDMVIVSFSQTSALFDNTVVEAGGFAVNCNHMLGHCEAPPEVQLAAWEFLKAHPFGTVESPYAEGLPDGFPDYCTIWEPS